MRGPRATAVAALAVAVAGGLGLATNAHAHPFDVFGYGSRAAALGGAYTALADGYEAAYYNPAGVTRSPGVRLGAGYSASFSDLTLNGDSLELRDTPWSGTSIGASATGRISGRALGMSLGFAVPDRGSIRATTRGTTDPHFILLSNRVQRAEILATVGVEVVRGLSIGGGIAMGAELEGLITIDSSLFPQDVEGSADIDIQSRVFPVLGTTFDVWDHLRVGVAYRGETSLSLAQPAVAVIQLTPSSPISADLLLFVEQTYFFSPHQIAGGVAYDPAPGWTVSLDGTWADWSSFGDPGLRGELSVGGELGALLEVAGFRESEAPNFHDIFIPRVGIEHRPVDAPLGLAALRVGYAFEPSPAPAASGVRNLLDNDKHVVSAGLGFAFRDPWGILLEDATFDVHAQYFRFAERTVEKSDPTDPVGDLRFGGDRWLVGGMLTLYF